MGDNKRFTIRGCVEPERYGIAASTLNEVIDKGCTKLKIQKLGAQVYLELDGTLVEDEDYFHLLVPDTVLVLCERGKTWKCDPISLPVLIQQILDRLSRTNYQKEVDHILSTSPSEIKRLLVEFTTSQKGNINAEDRNEDPAWFGGMDQRYKTKSQVMFDKAKDRVRGYFTKTKDTLKLSKENFSQASLVHYELVLKELRDTLKANKYHGFYFERNCKHEDRLCDENGWFQCEGRYNLDECSDAHLINPYSTKDNLTFFSSWNLDHVIEKQREVIPRLGDAIQNCPINKQVNVKYFYELLFTRQNLKLVDIRCHDKGIHHGRVAKSKLYRKIKR
ncbi:DNA fragmentation factor subunit beta-like [Asterias rubens]|uniref:DNA fragmentation factor subunit beta-like n=1 Tax=Asterias rubens TaxID=7604 RepID=UPI0014554E32|nr:DNA fragmentation factor subunit beta-like [Asterias rubens]